MPAASATTERRRILVQGIVQGVGFRPFVYGQALRCGLAGFVLNDSAGVTIEVEGAPAQLDQFEHALRAEAPPLARVDALRAEPLPPRGEHGFVIAHSQAGAARRTLIAPDSATCPDCLRELFDPADRRYRYPFINCTNCGPRFTIVQDVPYDRASTTMRGFPMCPRCQAEYENPLDRRFHAQPNACPVCGPAVQLRDKEARRQGDKERECLLVSLSPCLPVSPAADPIKAAAALLAQGGILALKGLGGYHLACDALDAAAVARLRARKHREAKPFALMMADLASARQLCVIDDAEADLLAARQRPIVLLARRADCATPPALAPGHATLGLMLPYSPLHHLLLHDFAALVGPGRPAALVLTSGNLSDEPIAYEDDDARARLMPIAEAMLTHNRPIHLRCDDSVAQVVAGAPTLLRRSRGYAPEPIELGFTCSRSLLACGGHQKNTFCLAKERQAFVGHHIGDLENLETLSSFHAGIRHFARLFDCAPEVVAYDLHPEYLASKAALESAIPLKIGVQHHHAHIASVLAEHGLAGPVIGLAADGTGYGLDGAVWGCELLLADLRGFERLAQLAYVPLPGGEQAVRQPWRMAAAYLAHTYGAGFLDLELPFTRGLDRARWRTLSQMIARGLNCPPTSSLGRLFDAVAALIGLRGEVAYEGQAAVELAAIAAPAEQGYPFAIVPGAPAQLDVRPLIRAIVDDLQRGAPAAQIAGRFHCALADMLAAACAQACAASGLREVALSGGVFQNRALTELLAARLERRGLHVYLNRRVPANDGGLSLGQAAVAAALSAE